MGTISALRREYKKHSLTESDVLENPIAQFQLWFQEALDAEVPEANAMVLSTVSDEKRPSSRVVLLKEIDANGFVFFTNYASRKARDLASNPAACLTFLWHELERQVRIEGWVEKISRHETEVYFHSRPRESQIGAWASPQSEVIASRQEIEERLAYLTSFYQDTDVLPVPEHWGGFRLKPDAIEFWQGRPSRLHDRITYLQQEGAGWQINRLAP